mmetsp:Transcript_42378/g.78530  ORF Transcript_42378/g.78530 Transcript_42378/m.78530 type:complete len:281 (-) Transcript_42378:1624-2466(-)
MELDFPIAFLVLVAQDAPPLAVEPCELSLSDPTQNHFTSDGKRAGVAHLFEVCGRLVVLATDLRQETGREALGVFVQPQQLPHFLVHVFLVQVVRVQKLDRGVHPDGVFLASKGVRKRKHGHCQGEVERGLGEVGGGGAVFRVLEIVVHRLRQGNLVLLLETVHRVAVLVAVPLRLLLLLLLLAVADLHQALLLPRQEQQVLVELVSRRDALLKLLLHHIPQQLPRQPRSTGGGPRHRRRTFRSDHCSGAKRRRGRRHGAAKGLGGGGHNGDAAFRELGR